MANENETGTGAAGKTKGGALSLAAKAFTIVSVATVGLGIIGGGFGVFAPATLGLENLVDMFAGAAENVAGAGGSAEMLQMPEISMPDAPTQNWG
jgi:hypothetical protein